MRGKTITALSHGNQAANQQRIMINLLEVIHLMMKYQLSFLIPVTNGEGHCKK